MGGFRFGIAIVMIPVGVTTHQVEVNCLMIELCVEMSPVNSHM